MLFRGNAEADIRRALIRKGYIKDGPKNRLRAMDIHKIVDVFNKRLELPKYSRMVGFEEIEKNEFNLNLPRYIDSQQAEDIQDIEGHLRGGIPTADVDALEPFWTVCPQLRQTLFQDNRPGYLDLAVDKAAIKPAIYDHPEFVAFIRSMNALFAKWRKRTAATLKALNPSRDREGALSSPLKDPNPSRDREGSALFPSLPPQADHRRSFRRPPHPLHRQAAHR